MRAVGDARDADAVVRAPARSCPATSVPWPLRSYGKVVAADEVVAAHEAAAVEVGRLAGSGGPAGAVGDAGVEHRDDHAAAAGAAGRDRVVPGVWASTPNGPTKFHWSAAQPPVPAARVVGREGGRAWRRSWAARGRRAGRRSSFAAACGERLAAGHLARAACPAVDHAGRLRPRPRAGSRRAPRRWCPRRYLTTSSPGTCGGGRSRAARAARSEVRQPSRRRPRRGRLNARVTWRRLVDTWAGDS